MECKNSFSKAIKISKIDIFITSNMNKNKIPDLTTYNICTDSRAIEPGCLFFAIKGKEQNGELFIEEALKKKAAFIVVEKDHKPKFLKCRYIFVKNIRSFLSKLATLKYRNNVPNIVAVTGTNGKTSVAHFFKELCTLTGFKTASIGTLGLQGAKVQEVQNYLSNHTTPPPLELHQLLKKLSESSYTHVALEASSHGLAQHRIDNLKIKAAAFTNITQDHLDYHGNLETYFLAKAKLFSEILKNGASAIINTDSYYGKRLIEICKRRSINLLDFGIQAKAFRIISLSERKVALFNKIYVLDIKLQGDFQFYNILAAMGLAYSCGISLEILTGELKHLSAPIGRLEHVGNFNGGSVYIDYAHTPDSLKKILQTLRKTCKNKLHILFGCGGDRDRGKRPVMGKIANQLADSVYVTDDNPRGEQAFAIRKEILQFCSKGIDVGNRSVGINFAVTRMNPGDVLVIAGKGHENYQIIDGTYNFFSDHTEVQKTINGLRKGLRLQINTEQDL